MKRILLKYFMVAYNKQIKTIKQKYIDFSLISGCYNSKRSSQDESVMWIRIDCIWIRIQVNKINKP